MIESPYGKLFIIDRKEQVNLYRLPAA